MVKLSYLLVTVFLLGCRAEQQLAQFNQMIKAVDAKQSRYAGDEDELIPIFYEIEPNEDSIDPTIVITKQPVNGELVKCTPQGLKLACHYRPTANFFGIDSFEVLGVDGGIKSKKPARIILQVSAVPDAPIAYSQTETISYNEPYNFKLEKANDVDSSQQQLKYIITKAPSYGALQGCESSLDNCLYIPQDKFLGNDYFEYYVEDETQLKSEVQKVSLNVIQTKVIKPISDSYSPREDQQDFIIEYEVPTNKLAIEPKLLIQSTPKHGKLKNCELNGLKLKCGYIPNTNYHGPDEFYVTTKDGTMISSEWGKISLNILAVPDRPIIGASQQFEVNVNTPIYFEVNPATDVDSSAEQLTYQLLNANDIQGSVTNCFQVARKRGCTYRPAPGVIGDITLKYNVKDETNLISKNSQNIIIKVKKERVEIQPRNAYYFGDEDAVIKIENYEISKGQYSVAPKLIITKQPEHGELRGCNTGNLKLNCNYHPKENYNGVDKFEVKIEDSGKISNKHGVITLNIKPINDAPVIGETIQKESLVGKILIFEVPQAQDIDGDELTYIPYQTNKLEGQFISCFENNSRQCKYKAPLVAQNETFQYKVNDGTVDLMGEFKIRSKYPAFAEPADKIFEQIDEDSKANLLEYEADTPENSHQPHLVITSYPTKGSFDQNCSINGLKLECLYTPNPNEFGEDSFQVKITDYDDNVTSNEATLIIPIRNVNDDPIVEAKSIDVIYGQEVTFSRPNVEDIDSDLNKITFALIENNPELISSDCLSDASDQCTYKALEYKNGEDKIKIKVDDGDGGTVVTEITVNIARGELAAPDEKEKIPWQEDKKDQLVYKTSIPSNADNPELKLANTSTEKDGSLSNCQTIKSDSEITLTCLFEPKEHYHGDDFFEVYFHDSFDDSDTTKIKIDIDGVIDTPILADQDAIIVEQDSEKEFIINPAVTNELLEGSLEDKEELSYKIETPPSHGEIVGCLTEETKKVIEGCVYKPDAGYNGDDFFSIVAVGDVTAAESDAKEINVTVEKRGRSIDLTAQTNQVKPKVSILMVVDNSPSMKPYQSRLKTQIEKMLKTIQNTNTDVILTSSTFLGESETNYASLYKQVVIGNKVSALLDVPLSHEHIEKIEIRENQADIQASIDDAISFIEKIGDTGSRQERILTNTQLILQGTDLFNDTSYGAVLILTNEDNDHHSNFSYSQNTPINISWGYSNSIPLSFEAEYKKLSSGFPTYPGCDPLNHPANRNGCDYNSLVYSRVGFYLRYNYPSTHPKRGQTIKNCSGPTSEQVCTSYTYPLWHTDGGYKFCSSKECVGISQNASYTSCPQEIINKFNLPASTTECRISQYGTKNVGTTRTTIASDNQQCESINPNGQEITINRQTYFVFACEKRYYYRKYFDTSSYSWVTSNRVDVPMVSNASSFHDLLTEKFGENKFFYSAIVYDAFNNSQCSSEEIGEAKPGTTFLGLASLISDSSKKRVLSICEDDYSAAVEPIANFAIEQTLRTFKLEGANALQENESIVGVTRIRGNSELALDHSQYAYDEETKTLTLAEGFIEKDDKVVLETQY